ncbi:hypothetical protein Q5530_07085 [Saccharothrix sp. BKS2]|uniref:DUF6895 family protein n=1 Tax=Saccharothrix sp. BKS2 TaxID=3064400 RepID=UPI0039EC256C
MTPPARYRGLVDGFPRWTEQPEPVLSGGRDTLGEALGWLETHLSWFDPSVWQRVLSPRPFPAGPLLELLQLCEVAGRAGRPCSRLLDRALPLAVRLVRTRAFAAGLHRGDALFTYHAWLIALLMRFGEPVDELAGAVERLLDAGVRPSADTVAALELAYVIDLGGWRGHLPGAGALYDRWLAGQHLNPFLMTDNECYAFTHAVFYATGFGVVALGGDVSAAGEVARLLFAAKVAEGDLDLGAELALTALLAGGPPSRAAWRRVSGAQRADGAVPGPLHRPDLLSGVSGPKADGYLFGTCYHTTVATALAAAGLERAGAPT